MPRLTPGFSVVGGGLTLPHQGGIIYKSAGETRTAPGAMFSEIWQPQDLTDATYVGILEIPEAECEDTPVFEVLKTADCLVFGGSTNATFLQSGYLRLEPDESQDTGLQELVEDLRVFYTDGPSYVSRIVVNERM